MGSWAARVGACFQAHQTLASSGRSRSVWFVQDQVFFGGSWSKTDTNERFHGMRVRPLA